MFFFWSDTGLIAVTSLHQFASADFFHEEMKTDDKLTLTCSAVTARGILAPLLVTSHLCSLAQPLQLYLLCRHFLMLCRGLLLGSSAGIPLLVSCFQSMFCCSCFIHPPPLPRPTWLMRQAVPIDVTSLGFVHKIFFFLLQTLPPTFPPIGPISCSVEATEWTEVAEWMEASGRTRQNLRVPTCGCMRSGHVVALHPNHEARWWCYHVVGCFQTEEGILVELLN